jgi:hypothetical protein
MPLGVVDSGAMLLGAGYGGAMPPGADDRSTEMAV